MVGGAGGGVGVRGVALLRLPRGGVRLLGGGNFARALAQQLRGGGFDGQTEGGGVRIGRAVHGAHRLRRGLVDRARREHAGNGRQHRPAEHGRVQVVLRAARILPAGCGLRFVEALEGGKVDEVCHAARLRRAVGVEGPLLFEHEVQHAFGAGEGDVEEAQLVGGAAAALPAVHEAAQQRVRPGARLEVICLRNEAPLVVVVHARRLLVVEGGAHARDDDDGELEPLGGVHGHQADGVFAAALRTADAAVVFEPV